LLLAVASAVVVGCSGETIPLPRAGRGKPGGDQGGPGTAGVLTAVTGDGTATLKGVVKLTGGEPNYAGLTAALRAEFKQDRDHCLDGKPEETSQYGWVVDEATKGIKNVFVWLRPEDDKTQFFDVSTLVADNDKGKYFPTEVNIDQPHCAFLPHAVVLFSHYVDPAAPTTNHRKWKPSGQRFVVKNSAPINHNFSYKGDPDLGISGNTTMSPRSKNDLTDNIRPSFRKPIEAACGIHPWMRGYIWDFNHPFAAVTNDKGEFEIKNVPAGVKLRVVAWHEVAGFLGGDKARGEEIEFKKDESKTKDFTATAK
jgi:hypothetical protein